MNQLDTPSNNRKSQGWYCLRSHPKHEHIAAAHLRGLVGEIEVFCPRLRIKRRCRRGAVWFVEAMFPGYLFARFNPGVSMQRVKSSPGIKAVVSFGLITVTIRDEIIQELKADFNFQELHEVPDDIRPGDQVTITTGPFHGLRANVIRLLPARDRVQLLLDLLGRTMPVEVDREYLVTEKTVAQLLTHQHTRVEQTPNTLVPA